MHPWPTKKLGEVCDFKSIKNTKFLPYIGMEDVESNSGRFNGSLTPRRVKSTTTFFDASCVLYGKLRPYLNKVFLPDFEGHCTTEFVTLRPDLTQVSREWLTQWLRSEWVVAEMTKSGSGARMPRANLQLLRSFEIPLPPLEIQKKVVKKIEGLFAKIDQAQSLRETATKDTNDLIPATLSKIFEEGKNKGWEKKGLGELFEITSSKRVFKSEWTENGIPFYRAREIVSMAKGQAFKSPIFVSKKMYEKYKEKYGVPKGGDILATGVGTLGITYCVKNDDKFYFKDGNIIWFKKKSDVNSNFIDYFFKSDVLRKQVDENAGGATVRTFTIKTANRVKVPLPPIAEQKRIVERMDALTQKVRELQKLQSETSANLTALKQSILHKAFQGELIN